jgi:hypothetical protein
MFKTRSHLDVFIEGDEAGRYFPGQVEAHVLKDGTPVLRITTQLNVYISNLAQAEAIAAAGQQLLELARQQWPAEPEEVDPESDNTQARDQAGIAGPADNGLAAYPLEDI